MGRTKWTRWCLLLCGAGFLLSVPAFAQRYLTLEEYRGLIEEAQRGPLGAKGRELARYRPESLGLVVTDFLREPPPAAAIKRAALVHTEAALGLGGGGEAHLALATKLNLAIPDPASRESWLRRWSLAVAHSITRSTRWPRKGSWTQLSNYCRVIVICGWLSPGCSRWEGGCEGSSA